METNFLGIEITEVAQKELAILANEKRIRIYLKGGGCSGYTVCMDFMDPKEELGLFDFEFAIEKVSIVIDERSLSFMQGAILDYISKNLLERGFKWNFPGKSGCGCGQSFSL